MTADTVGGVWTYALDLSQALGEAGVQVLLATMGGSANREQRREAGAVANLELVESEYRLPWMDDPWEDVAAAGDWLLDLTTRFAPDLVHLNEPVHGSLPWPTPTIAVAHSCVVSWWQSVWNTEPPADWDRYREAMTRGLRHADEVVAPSQWLLDTLRRNYGISHGRVIANGRASHAFDPERKEPLIFAAGRLWDPAKNLLALEEVAEGLAWPIYVAGDPRHPSRDETASARQVHLLGRVPSSTVAAWLRRASVYVFPARYEPFGLSVLEAALAGCALVLGDLPTLRELWDGAAVFVDPDDTGTLRLAVDSLIRDPGLRQALAMRARRRGLSLTPRRMARAYLALYAELLTARVHVEDHACAS